MAQTLEIRINRDTIGKRIHRAPHSYPSLVKYSPSSENNFVLIATFCSYKPAFRDDLECLSCPLRTQGTGCITNSLRELEPIVLEEKDEPRILFRQSSRGALLMATQSRAEKTPYGYLASYQETSERMVYTVVCRSGPSAKYCFRCERLDCPAKNKYFRTEE